MRKKDKAGADVKEGIMTAALAIQGIYEFLEGVEDGADLPPAERYLTAAGRAVKTHRLRGEALARANQEVVRRSRRVR